MISNMATLKKKIHNYFVNLLDGLILPLWTLRVVFRLVHGGFQDAWGTGCVAIGKAICFFVACVAWYPVYVSVCMCGLDGFLPRFLHAGTLKSLGADRLHVATFFSSWVVKRARVFSAVPTDKKGEGMDGSTKVAGVTITVVNDAALGELLGSGKSDMLDEGERLGRSPKRGISTHASVATGPAGAVLPTETIANAAYSVQTAEAPVEQDDLEDCLYCKGDYANADVHIIDVRGTTCSKDNSFDDIVTTYLARELVELNPEKVVHQVFSGPYHVNGFSLDQGVAGYDETIRQINAYVQANKVKRVIFLGYSRGCLRLKNVALANPNTLFYGLMLDATLGGLPEQSDSALQYKAEYTDNVKWLVNLVCDLKIPGFNSHFFDLEWSDDRKLFEVVVPTDHLLIAEPTEPRLAETIAKLFNQMIAFYNQSNDPITIPTQYIIQLNKQPTRVNVTDDSMLSVAESLVTLNKNRPRMHSDCSASADEESRITGYVWFELFYNRLLNKAPSVVYPSAARVMDKLEDRLQAYNTSRNNTAPNDFSLILLLGVHTHAFPSLLRGRGWALSSTSSLPTQLNKQQTRQRRQLLGEMQQRLRWLDTDAAAKWTNQQRTWHQQLGTAIAQAVFMPDLQSSKRELEKIKWTHAPDAQETRQLLRFLFVPSSGRQDDPCHPCLHAARAKIVAHASSSAISAAASAIGGTSLAACAYVRNDPHIQRAVNYVLQQCKDAAYTTSSEISNPAFWASLYDCVKSTAQACAGAAGDAISYVQQKRLEHSAVSTAPLGGAHSLFTPMETALPASCAYGGAAIPDGAPDDADAMKGRIAGLK